MDGQGGWTSIFQECVGGPENLLQRYYYILRDLGLFSPKALVMKKAVSLLVDPDLLNAPPPLTPGAAACLGWLWIVVES